MKAPLRSVSSIAIAVFFISAWLPQSEAGESSSPVSTAAAQATGPLKVFVLVGQSNMVGHAKAATLAALADAPETAELCGQIMDPQGRPRVLQDIHISSVGSSETEKVGMLTVGYGAERGGPKLGPELTFGLTVKSELNEPILLIKTAWGGKSLHTDFRSPSAGPFEFSEAQLDRMEERGKDIESEKAKAAAATGEYYRLMMEHVNSVLADIGRVVPGYSEKRGYELAGFVWFQGWNDMVATGVYPDRKEPGGYDAYTEALCHFIRDVRKDLSAPGLPFVIGVMGVGGPTDLYDASEQRFKAFHQNFRDAMAAPASMHEFKGPVQAVLTETCWDDHANTLRNRKRSLQQSSKRIDERLSAGELTQKEARKEKKALEEKALTADDLAYLDAHVSNAEYHYLGSGKIMTGIGVALAKGWSAAHAASQ